MSKPIHPIIVLISGNGSNLQALIDATSTPNLPSTKIIRVISNRKTAYGLTRAAEANIPTTYHNLVPYKKQQASTESGIQTARELYDRDLADLITKHDPKPSLVVCAGWMHILSPVFVNMLSEAGVAIINLHPALPGQFDGANAIQRAWAAFQRGEIASTGVMVHYVISEVDAGRPVITREVECRTGESESELETRIHEVEWGLIVEGTRLALEEIDRK